MAVDVKYPEIVVELVGGNGNAFAILATCTKAIRKAGLSKEEQEAFMDEAKEGDYDHLLCTCMKWFTVE